MSQHFGSLAEALGDPSTGASTLQKEIARLIAKPTGRLIVDTAVSGEVTLSSRLRCNPTKLFVLDDSESPELTVLYIDDHELEFDEPRMHAFATQIAKNRSFTVEECMRWGEPNYSFEDVREQLQTLVDMKCLTITS